MPGRTKRTWRVVGLEAQMTIKTRFWAETRRHPRIVILAGRLPSNGELGHRAEGRQREARICSWMSYVKGSTWRHEVWHNCNSPVSEAPAGLLSCSCQWGGGEAHWCGRRRSHAPLKKNVIYFFIYFRKRTQFVLKEFHYYL